MFVAVGFVHVWGLVVASLRVVVSWLEVVAVGVVVCLVVVVDVLRYCELRSVSCGWGVSWVVGVGGWWVSVLGGCVLELVVGLGRGGGIWSGLKSSTVRQVVVLVQRVGAGWRACY